MSTPNNTSLVVFLSGLPGAGKTALGRRLAQIDEVYALVSNDRLRSEAEYPWDNSAYTVKTYNLMATTAATYLREGKSVLLDATFYCRQYRSIVIERLKIFEPFWVLIHLRVSETTCRARVQARVDEKADDSAGMNDMRRFVSVLKKHQPFELLELPLPRAEVVMNTDNGLSLCECSNNTPKRLREILWDACREWKRHQSTQSAGKSEAK